MRRHLRLFDIGACEGEDSVRFARRFPNARVFAFEPLPANQALVRANFARFSTPKNELVPLALSDRAGEATFHVSSGRPRDEFAGQDWNYGNKSSSLLAPATDAPMYGWIEFKEAITVRTDTLDHFCHERGIGHIDLVHMDVQGAEHLVLAGARALLPHITAIWLEVSDQELYAGQKLRNEIHELMRSHGFRLGYELRRELDGDQLYVNTRSPRAWRYLSARAYRAFMMKARMEAGRIWHAISR
ncbi:MAG: FkbM family methyltransferase [Opitutae bacterium]|nr:FkbM family methyltransferase [Opitutae bacterium]